MGSQERRERREQSIQKMMCKSSATIIYDSTVDEFIDDSLFDKVKGKPNIAVVAFTTDGDVFGLFYSLTVMEQEQPFYDPNMFIFSFESHGRCETPQRFAVKREPKDKAFVNYDKNDNAWFVWFWVDYVGCFWLGNETSNSFCADLSCAFE